MEDEIIQFLSEVVCDYIEKHGYPPKQIDYDCKEGRKRLFFVIQDEYEQADMNDYDYSFWEKEENCNFMDNAIHKHMDTYYYPYCPKHIEYNKIKYSFTVAVVYNNVIYAEYSHIDRFGTLEKIVISKVYGEDYMNDLAKIFDQIEWRRIEEEQGELEEAIGDME